MLSHQKIDGNALSAKVYGNKRSSLYWLFNKFKYNVSITFKEEITTVLDGLKRLLSSSVKEGIGESKTGNREMSFQLYFDLSKWLISI